jgi:segregation and condensation protein A
MNENTNEAEALQPHEPCLVKTQLFEGPLDLLLHLIKKNEVDIYDIPIAVITEQYIEYLELMKELNLQVVGEYLVIAAELSLIKSKMLLPKPVIEEDEADPRDELVRRLIEYQRYRDAASELFDRNILGRDVFKRDNDISMYDAGEEVELVPVDLWSLIETFHDFYRRRSYLWADQIVYEVESITVEEKIEQVLERLRAKTKVSFEEFLEECASKFDLVVTFLALLELARTENVQVVQESPGSQILISYSGEGNIGIY